MSEKSNLSIPLTTYKECSEITWCLEMENILCQWADHAQCYHWLCYNSHKRYSILQASFSIPTIIFSTIIGAASFTNLSGNFSQYLPLVIGSVNVTIGVFTTIQQYFKISEYNENFRICARAWDKYAREIQIELSKPPNQRKECGLFIKKCSEDYERLTETTPNFPDDIVRQFTKTFNNKKDRFKMQTYERMYKPRILEGIHNTSDCRHSWYLGDRQKSNEKNKNDNDRILFEIQETLFKEKMEKQVEKIVTEQLENILKTEDNNMSNV